MAIDTLEAVELGGTTQWIRVRAADPANPVLLLMQQGPGMPMINEARRVEQLLGLEKEFTVVYWDQRGTGLSLRAAVGSAPELLEAVRRTSPEAVLTDIRMPVAGSAGHSGGAPAMEGIDAAHAIKAANLRVGVVILSQYADESYAFELFRNGTAGLAYLLKDRVGDLYHLLSALITCCPRCATSSPEDR
jgi:CheY-like chemotaxis protein